MKKFFFAACFLLIAFLGCKKQEMGCMTVEPQAEEPQILAYAKADSMQVTKHSSGIYYQIINPGSGATPSSNSTVLVTYTGKLLNGIIFAQHTSPVPFDLSGGIEGWQIGIPLIKKGGRINLIIPSAYAYGCNAVEFGRENMVIPSNSILFFEINLL